MTVSYSCKNPTNPTLFFVVRIVKLISDVGLG
jgi:hypothetical protein